MGLDLMNQIVWFGISILVTIFYIIVLVGMLQMRELARKHVIYFAFVFAVSAVMDGVIIHIIPVLLSLVYIYYLSRPNVQSLFR